MNREYNRCKYDLCAYKHIEKDTNIGKLKKRNKETLQKLGLKSGSGDPALYTFHKDGNLEGIVCFHVDDLFVAGSVKFKKMFLQEITKTFRFSKVESNKFKYLGCEVEKLSNGDIELNQNDYISNIAEVQVFPQVNSCPVNEVERKTIRRVVG